ncbi:MAG TPA: rod shape-determining protein RodA [Candidatus Aphodomonas merdavium]|nr:rod shape-determining protein RodA [Candidatus Aphodomonas merdavium]
MNRNTAVVNRKARQHFDIPLLLITYALAAFGVLAITVATYSYTGETLPVDTLLARITSSYYGKRQGLFLLVSPIAIAGMMAISYRFFQKFSDILYLASLALLAMVLVTGSTTSGVTGWFSLFSGYMLQPSEFAKLAAILHLAKFFSRKENPVQNFREFATMAVLMGLPVILIFAQGELGTVMVFIAIYGAMMIMSGISLKLVLGIVGAGAAAIVPVVLYWRATGSYRYDRLLGFFNPEMASSDSIYQATNSKTAIGNGGLHGVGLFKDGTYSALNYVPQDHTDFIFSSIGETMGFIGCSIVMVLYLLMIYRLLSLAINTYDKFARLVIVGFTMMIFFHAFYNIGMTIGVMPVMGIPLPFLSYGGSNLIANMGGVGLVLNITLRKPQTRMNAADEAVLLSKRPTRRGARHIG